MRPVKFDQFNVLAGPPEGMANCGPMHVYADKEGYISCWEFTDAEIEEITRTRKAWQKVYTGSAKIILPVWVSAFSPFSKYNSMFYSCFYRSALGTHGHWVWIKADAPPPSSFRITAGGDLFLPATGIQPKYEPGRKMKTGDFYVDVLTREGDGRSASFWVYRHVESTAVTFEGADLVVECSFPQSE